jgi:transcriptional regulator with XRE-family HTH domain
MMLNLRQLRIEKGLTQDQLAEMTGLSKGFLSQLETGARQPSTESLGLLSSALRVTEAELIAPTGFREPGPQPSMARRILTNIDKPPDPVQDPDFKLGTDGTMVQIIATVDRDGLAKLIQQLEIMHKFLSV